ncbi:hypothetical protein Gohar_015558 [Gossypium harknessii]|uniref:Uncharacterized protein n=1 Tax=Gossypium harknessii TaxID=34285 RepID=A0A7J9G2B7_9ROSI|nr:hypothetical protein [Gossypium harknessii]
MSVLKGVAWEVYCMENKERKS